MPSERRSCRYCGREVLFEDETYTVMHAEPICVEFEKLMEAAVAEGMAVLEEQGLPVLDIRRLN